MEFVQSLFSLTWLATLIAFIVFWRKKVNAKKSAGENYADDENYKHISKIKKFIGIACIVSFVIASAIPVPKNSAVTNNVSNNVQNDEKSLGVTPEEFANNFNKAPIGNLKIVKVEDSKKSDNFYYFIQNNIERKTHFTGITEGQKLVNVQYLIPSNSNFDDFMNCAVAILQAIPNTNDNDFFKKIGSDISDEKNYKNGSFSEVYNKNGLEIILNLNVANSNSILISTEEYVKKIRSK